MFPSRIAVILLFTLMLLIPARPAVAYEPINADTLMKACEAPAKKFWDSGVISEMKRGDWAYQDCLEKIFLDQIKVMFDPEDYPVAYARHDLSLLYNAVTLLYRNIYMEHKGCPCGPSGPLRYNAEYSSILEGMIRQLVEQRNDAGPRIFKKQRK